LREFIDHRRVFVAFERAASRSIDRDLALLASCPTIERVQIDNEELTQAGLLQLHRFKRLRHLALHDCGRTDADLPLIGRLSDLRSLDLSSNRRLTGRTFHALRGLINLRQLSLCANDDADATQLAHLRHLPLTDIDLGLACLTDANSLVLACFPRLERLCVRDTLVSDESVRVFQHLPRLTAVNISRTRIGERGLRALLRLPRIAEVDVGGTLLTDASARAIAACPTLVSLEADECKLTSAGFLALTGSRSLRSLSLANTRITDAHMRAFVRMPSLRQLNVSWCRITEVQVKELRRIRPGFRLDL
jgi:Leucine-rich repeat (LRR) protein